MTAYVPSAQNATTDQIVRSLREQASGRSNATGNVTLRPSQTTTVVNDANFVPGGVVVLCPTTANARTALNTAYIDITTLGAFTVHHASSANADQFFTYAIIG